LDANNLYGLAMCKKFPYDDFKWHYDKMDEKKIMKYCNNDNIKYILEINLDYPKELHDLHTNYPLAPEIMNINKNILSKIQKNIHKYYYGKNINNKKTNKLVLNTMEHISTLKFYL
jgi:hypothetical protein